jgi:3-deoxy-7-phosphoheptulonate synthase
MIVSMRPDATKAEIRGVSERVEQFGLRVHTIPGEERVVIAVVGTGDVGQALDALSAMPGVDRALRITAPYKFVSKEFRPARTVVRVNGRAIGGDRFAVVAGPCSVESEEQILETADGVAATGATLLRGGAYKPRSSPYEFQGLGVKGLMLLAKAKRATGLGIVTEVLSEQDVGIVAEYADMVQVGARNMQNFALLKALGRCGRPVLLKRGLSATIKELLMSAEYVVAHGNPHVVLCERGIRTFETATRNTCDISAIPSLNELTHLPVMLDPSHASGKRSLVPALARAAVAVGADGILVEVHPRPDQALSDGAQSLDLSGFRAMMRDLEGYIDLWRAARLPQISAVA